ncbi:glycosyltransferase family 4 protein [Hahella aquimaris]|uniref:MraY family glycosyltransferase n=1 Tax=Hahella sp. HNIBRBA332 TaxID=3015983 RepID=UPI00273B77F9|nr:glycosyltransferase family 4 protein [Hahella sp. HNIBRBA332]WLQ15468.1 glycosyltransferase family 4 protein [Hahella sp. HNIBRBA332]
MDTLVLLLILGIASFLLTGWARRYALAKKVLDIPEARSSHTVPTPRGGGISIVVCILIVLPFLGGEYGWVLWCTLALLALVSYVDDHRGLGFKVRLLVQLVCAYALVYFVWMSDRLYHIRDIDSYVADLVVILLAIFGVVWITNLYNFMDGIDGIAATEAIFVSSSLAGVYAYSGEYVWAWIMLAIVVSSMGFLCWNWAPAKIFMGDIGSISLGWLFGAGMLVSSQVTQVEVWVYLILMGVFISDASCTLLARFFNGEKIWLPHRTHLYQLLSVRLGDHRKVNYLLIFVNVVWLLPMALFAFMMADWAWGFAVAAYAPLLLICAVARGRLIANSKAEEC